GGLADFPEATVHVTGASSTPPPPDGTSRSAAATCPKTCMPCAVVVASSGALPGFGIVDAVLGAPGGSDR
ncbi:MAG: hypothetical protein ACRD0U_17865, partial [Acidimicrobiales bacterium]